tara:strand:+ start:162 stop:464 length:303 start_codon:yes stop_codon:yes gene_type:complete
MSSLERIQELLDKATEIAEEVQEVKVKEKKKDWRKQDIQDHLRTMDRNSSHFVLWLSWLRETKNFDAEKIIDVVEHYYNYVDEFQEFLEDWYDIKDEAPF